MCTDRKYCRDEKNQENKKFGDCGAPSHSQVRKRNPNGPTACALHSGYLRTVASAVNDRLVQGEVGLRTGDVVAIEPGLCHTGR